jgi:F-type H+-transporting ATPase subunit b
MPEFNATLVLVMVSFVIFMMAMKAIYFDPILKIKLQREEKLKDDRASAQRFAEAFERLHADYESGLQQARKEAHQLIQEIRQQAKTDAQKALADARALAQTETDRQMTELNAWRESTYRQLEAERDALKRAVIAKVTSNHKIRTASGGSI